MNKKEPCKKQLILAWAILSIFLSGCATPKASPYPSATFETKQQLYQDLQSGKLQGATLDYVKTTYGEAESTAFLNEKVLIIYRRPEYYDSAYLWFDQHKHLESWSH